MTWRPVTGRFVPPRLPSGQDGDPGLFGPGSAAWRIGRERCLLASGPAALLMQLAHPLVAAGVATHSDFTGDPLRRLQGTLDAVLTVTFGDTHQVRGAARHVARQHRTVHGTLPVSTGPIAAGTPYRAGDRHLSLWVFATLVWTSVGVTDGFARPVPPRERDAYYRDMTQLAHRFGVPAAVLPDSYAELDRYVHRQVRDVLAVGPTAARLAQEVLRPDPPIVAAPARPLPALLAAGVLPAALREAYDLPWRRQERLAFRAVQRATRRGLPLVPARLRYWPHYLVATERVRRPSPDHPTGTGVALRTGVGAAGSCLLGAE